MSRIGLLFIILIAASNCQTLPCTWTSNGKTYDLSMLRNPGQDYYIPKNTYPKQEWDIWINVCRTLVNPLCGGDTIACQEWDSSNPQGHAKMGSASSQLYQDATNGLTLQYVNGDDNRQTEIDFICDTGAGLGKPEYSQENPQHHYTFAWKSSYACPVSPGGGGLSPGSILLIILLVLVVVYLVAGILFNKFRRQMNGIELIPNVTFWTSIPGLVKDGVMFIVNKVRGRGSYTQVG